jgi:hypothetical protein
MGEMPIETEEPRFGGAFLCLLLKRERLTEIAPYLLFIRNEAPSREGSEQRIVRRALSDLLHGAKPGIIRHLKNVSATRGEGRQYVRE